MQANDTAPKTGAGAGSDAEASQQVARAALVAQSGAQRDGGQGLPDALEKNCGQEKFLAGVICEQKVRLRYCDGKWGDVPECTAKPRVD